jgi:hypothetical protein
LERRRSPKGGPQGTVNGMSGLRKACHVAGLRYLPAGGINLPGRIVIWSFSSLLLSNIPIHITSLSWTSLTLNSDSYILLYSTVLTRNRKQPLPLLSDLEHIISQPSTPTYSFTAQPALQLPSAALLPTRTALNQSLTREPHESPLSCPHHQRPHHHLVMSSRTSYSSSSSYAQDKGTAYTYAPQSPSPARSTTSSSMFVANPFHFTHHHNSTQSYPPPVEYPKHILTPHIAYTNSSTSSNLYAHSAHSSRNHRYGNKPPVVVNGGGQSNDPNTSTSAPNSGYYS